MKAVIVCYLNLNKLKYEGRKFKEFGGIPKFTA